MESPTTRRSARFDLRIDPEFKKQFIKFCKKHQINFSDAARGALQQYVDLGSFKKELFEFLHNHVESREAFKKFIGSLYTGEAPTLIPWFEELIGSEEELLINSTPILLLPKIRNTFLTDRGHEAFEKRMNNK